MSTLPVIRVCSWSQRRDFRSRSRRKSRSLRAGSRSLGCSVNTLKSSGPEFASFADSAAAAFASSERCTPDSGGTGEACPEPDLAKGKLRRRRMKTTFTIVIVSYRHTGHCVTHWNLSAEGIQVLCFHGENFQRCWPCPCYCR